MPIHNSSIIHSNSLIEENAIIGKNCKIGPFCYVSSDCVLEDNIELFSHVSIVGKTLIGKNTKVWPFASIGHYPQDLKYKGENNELIIGALSMVAKDVIPFGMVYGERAKLMGLNLVGLRRSGTNNKQIKELKSVYDNIFFNQKTFNKKISNIADINNPLVKKLINFLNAEKDRAILSPK